MWGKIRWKKKDRRKLLIHYRTEELRFRGIRRKTGRKRNKNLLPTGEDKEFIVISLFSVTMKCKFSPFKWKNSGRTVLKCSNIVKRRIKYTRRNSYFSKCLNNVVF